MNDLERLISVLDSSAEYWDASGAVAVIRDGKTVIRRFYGYADRENNIPLSERSTFCLSFEGGMAGICMLLLEDMGYIKPNDTLDKYIPDYKYADRIAIKQLINYSAGLPDWYSDILIPGLEKIPSHTSLSFNDRYIKEYSKAFGADFEKVLTFIDEIEPDFKFYDRRTCYSFMAEIIRRVTNLSVQEFMLKYIFKPLKMYDTIPGNSSNTVCYNYIMNTTMIRLPRMNCSFDYTTTIDDMVKLADALMYGGLLSDKSRKKAESLTKGLGPGIVYDYIDGMYSFFCQDWLQIRFSRELGLGFVLLKNENTREEKINGNWCSFNKDLRREIPATFIYPTAPEIVPYGKNNALSSMNITIENSQLVFVKDARTTICWALANKNTDKVFVLTDCGQTIGIASLRADLRNKDYDIQIVLIDKRFQGRGYGRFMMMWCIEYLHQKGAVELTISCHRNNTKARHLYESLGFIAEKVTIDNVLLRLRF